MILWRAMFNKCNQERICDSENQRSIEIDETVFSHLDESL